MRNLRRIAWLMLGIGLCSPVGSRARGGDAEATIETADGRRVTGRLQGSAAAGFSFAPTGGGTPLPLESLKVIRFASRPPDAAAAPAPFRVFLGNEQRVSGSFQRLSSTALTLAVEPGKPPLEIAREGVRALVQRPGEALVLAETFDRLDPERWSVHGGATIVTGPDDPRNALRLPAGGSSVSWKLPEALASGRVEILFDDDARRAVGHRWLVELTFRTATGSEPIQVIAGWEDEGPSVRSRDDGPALAVQRLLRAAGPHRLSALFGPDRTDLALDGNELAHGDGPSGPLIAIRLATEAAPSAPASDLAAMIREVRVIRFASPSTPVEIDPSQDEARLVSGDQLFGEATAADAEGVRFAVDGRSIALPWAELAGMTFRRQVAASRPLDGLWIQASWRVSAGRDPEDQDRVEGVLAALDDDAITLQVPYAGTLTVPRLRLSEIRPIGTMRRMIIDPTSHHLGNTIIPDLDPPQPEGASLEIPFDVEAAPAGRTLIGLDVLQVVGVEGNPDFSALVRRGELLTTVKLNGQVIDTLNRHVTTRNDTPVRVRLPVPQGVLKTGANVLSFEQQGTKEDPDLLDNLGLSRVALEIDSTAARPGAPP
jgi:hypothetical protein